MEFKSGDEASKKKLARKLLDGIEFDTPENAGDELITNNDGDDDDDEDEDMNKDVEEMLKIWNKDQIFKEVNEEKERIQLESKVADLAEVYYDGKTSFDELAKTMRPLDESKQVYINITESNVDGKIITALCTVLYNHIGYIENDPIPFESSHYDKKPVKVNLLEGPIIPGLLNALLTMREGESANVLIMPSMAFGYLPLMGLHTERSIPPGSSFYYHINVLKVWEESELQEALRQEMYNNIELPMEYKLKLINEHKEVANQFFKDNQLREAVIRYKAAIKLLDEYSEFDNDNELSHLMLTLLQNVGVALNKLEMHKSATKYLKRAHFMEPTSIKSLYQLAKARVGLMDFTTALEYINKADKIIANEHNINQLKCQINREMAKEKQKRHEIMLKMSRAFK